MCTGLSPRVRGNLGNPGYQRRPVRSIPACAGEPLPALHQPASSPVYPRVCGGTAASPRGQRNCNGLSPRVRGNPMMSIAGRHRGRSIPACAGEPVALIHCSLLLVVYPRVCGGTQETGIRVNARQGLSPRVRGNPMVWSDQATCWRSIPACAGEPRNRPGLGEVSQVYPRVCGGTQIDARGRGRGQGLSPRVRGNLPPG